MTAPDRIDTETPVRVLVTEELDDAAFAWIAERHPTRRIAPTDVGFGEALAAAAALVVRTYTRVDAALLRRAPRLLVVGRAGVGLDNIDLEACRARNIRVVSTPEANAGAVSELVFALLLDVLRPREALESSLDPASWRTLRTESLVAERELSELVLGVLGYGRVGRKVARIALGFGMRVLAHDLAPFDAEPERVQFVDLETLVRSVDILSVHVDGRPSNHHLIDGTLLAMRPPASILINTSRGFVVDPRALARFLVKDPDATAILDVHEPEPIPEGHPLLGLPNAYLLPHIGAATAAARRRMSAVVEDVHRVLLGEDPRFPAD